MRHMIKAYRNLTGEHCGSTAMRNLLYHYCGLELSEEMVFGLGSGLDFIFVRQQEEQPSVAIFGRGLTLEVDVASALGVDYREQPVADNTDAWLQVRNEVMMERPTMLSGDAYYLDYRDFRVHFPAHRFVLLGFDDDKSCAYVADRLDQQAQPCSYEALRLSRNPPEFISTYNLWGKFHGKTAERSIEEACAKALAKNARRMLGRDNSQLQLIDALAAGRSFKASVGLAGMREFLDYIPELANHEDLQVIASYASSCIEKFGTGGGNFRLMYAGFLREARRVDASLADLADKSAVNWTKMAEHFSSIAEDDVAEPGAALRGCQEAFAKVIDLETELFEKLIAE